MEDTQEVTPAQPTVDAVLSALADAIEGLNTKIAALEAGLAAQKSESIDLIQKSLASYVPPTTQAKEKDRQPSTVKASDVVSLSFAQLNKLRYQAK